MSTYTTRRDMLIAGGIALSIAGCTGNGTDGGADGSTDGSAAPADLDVRPPAVDIGEVVDDFENLSGWSYSVGNFDADESNRVLGTQAMHLESRHDGTVAEASRPFEEPIDLTDRHLSMAIDVDTTGAARIQFDLLAPDRHNLLRAERSVNRDLSGWVRIDLGYTNREGQPDLSQVEELRLRVRSTDDEPVSCWCDDLRATEAADAPRAVLVLNNARQAYHDRVFDILESNGHAAVVPIWRDGIGTSGRLGIDQLRTLRDAGWDVASRPTATVPLPELDSEEQQSVIGDNRAYLEGRGFPNGARHCVPAGYRMNADTVEAIRDVHETGITFGGCPNANPPVTRYTASLFNGDAGDATRRLVDLAGEYNQSVILAFSRISQEGDFTEEDFRSLLDNLDERDFEVRTLSELYVD